MTKEEIIEVLEEMKAGNFSGVLLNDLWQAISIVLLDYLYKEEEKCKL